TVARVSSAAPRSPRVRIRRDSRRDGAQYLRRADGQEEQYLDPPPARRAMKRSLALIGFGISALALAGCGNSVRASSGDGEPLVVRNGQFFEGDFPSPAGGPAIELPMGFRTSVIQAGYTSKKISGLTPLGSLSVALGIEGAGHGYWVVPVGS